MNRNENRVSRDDLERWLRLEQRGEDRRAEEALSGLLEALPSVVAPADFADNVLRASGLVASAESSPRTVRPWLWRAAFLLWSLVGFTAVILGGAVSKTLWDSGLVVRWATDVVVSISAGLSDFVTTVGGLFVAARAVSAAMSGPGVLLLCLTCAVTAVMLAKGLSYLIGQDRSYRHVHS